MEFIIPAVLLLVVAIGLIYFMGKKKKGSQPPSQGPMQGSGPTQ